MEQSQIIDTITQTINTIFSNIFSSIDNNIYANLDKVAFIDSNILSNSFFSKILGEKSRTGFLIIIDALLLGISLFYCIKLYFSHYAESNIEKPYQFIFKLIIFSIIINFSYFIIEQILNINYLLSASIQEIGKNVTGSEISFSELINKLDSIITFNETSLDIFSLDGILKSFISIGLVYLLFIYSIRYVLVEVFILFTPFTILCLINSSTSWIFRSWSKCLFSLLILQSIFPVVIMIIFSIDSENKILIVASILLLSKINNYVREILGGLSIDISGNFANMLYLFKK